MKILDAQVHIWRPHTSERPWLEPYSRWAHGPSLSAEDLLRQMDRAGVDGALLTGVPWDPDSTGMLIDAVTRYPDRFAALVAPNFHPPSNYEGAGFPEHLADLLDDDRVAGVRFAFFGPTAAELDRGDHDWIFDELARRGTPTACFAPQSLAKIAQLAADRPQLPITLCHLGMLAAQREPSIDDMTDRLVALAPLPNVSLKATGLPVPSLQEWPFADLVEPLRRLLDAYGAKRIFWGTDLTRLQRDGWSYDSSLRFMESLPILSGEARDLVMGGALRRWLRWPAWDQQSGAGV